VTSRLTPVDWYFLLFKLCLVIVWPVSLFGNHESVAPILSVPVMYAWVAISWIGFIISLVGLVMGAQRGTTRLSGLRVEVAGLYMFMAGPLIYTLVMAVLVFIYPIPGIVAQIFLGGALLSCVMARISSLRLVGMKPKGE
jgi:hypothetical protein